MCKPRLEDISRIDSYPYQIRDTIDDLCKGDTTLRRYLILKLQKYRQDEICDIMHINLRQYHMLGNKLRTNYGRLAG